MKRVENFISLLVQCDVSVQRGLLDKFIVKRVGLGANDYRYFASLGIADNLASSVLN